MTAAGESWDYTIRIGHGAVSEGHDPVCVFQITDDLGEPLSEGVADDVQDAITKVAAQLLNVHDDSDAEGKP